AVRQHRNALGKRECRDQVAHDSVANGQRGGVGRLTLDAPVATEVIVGAILVLFAIAFVVLCFVADEVAKREAVVRNDEVHTRVGAATAGLVDITRAGKPRRQVADGSAVAPPELPNRVSVLSVPFRPPDGGVARMVAARA